MEGNEIHDMVKRMPNAQCEPGIQLPPKEQGGAYGTYNKYIHIFSQEEQGKFHP